MGIKSITFLGLPIQVPNNPSIANINLKKSLEHILKLADQCPVTRKLKLYKLGVCPRLTWSLTIHEFPLTWVERDLDATTTCYLKKWAGLAKSAIPKRAIPAQGVW